MLLDCNLFEISISYGFRNIKTINSLSQKPSAQLIVTLIRLYFLPSQLCCQSMVESTCWNPLLIMLFKCWFRVALQCMTGNVLYTSVKHAQLLKVHPWCLRYLGLQLVITVVLPETPMCQIFLSSALLFTFWSIHYTPVGWSCFKIR